MPIKYARQKFEQAQELFSDTYYPSRWRKYGHQVQEMLECRAIFIHSIISIVRLITVVCQQSWWQIGLENRDKIAHNEAFVDSIANFATVGCWSLAVIGLVLDVACLKWIKLANVLFYLELLYVTISLMVPYKQGPVVSQLIIVLALLSAFCLYSNPLPNFIYLTVVVVWLVYVQLPLVWGNELSGTLGHDGISLALTVMFVFIGATMVITDIGRVKTYIKVQEKNDFNLLNKMQEGLFVLDKDR